MTTATSPIANLTDLAKERSSAMSTSTASKQHPERAEPRTMVMDYTSNNITSSGASYSGRHQQQGHYGQEHAGGYSDEYYDQQQHYNNGHSHHSSSSSSSSHYPHSSNGSYLPHPIQTVAFAGHGNGNGNGNSNNDSPIYASHHGHAQSIHGSFVSPTSPSAPSSQPSSNGAHNTYQQQQQQQSHYDYDHPQAQHHQYHTHHASHPQDHQHPLSPTEGNAHHFYGNHPAPAGKVDSGNSISNGSYSSSASSTHYSRNHSYGASTHSNGNGNAHGSHGSVDAGLPDGHGAGLGIGPDGMLGNAGNGRQDPSAVYSTSAPSPSTAHSLIAARPKRRSEMFTHQESPYFGPTQQHYNLLSADQSMGYSIKISAKIDRGFFLAASDWTCYRRNYFQLSAAFSIVGLDSCIHPEVPCLLDRNGELVTVRAFLICIGAQIQNGEKVIELVQHTPKRDKGPQITPRPTHIRAGGDLNLSSSGSNPNVVTFERVQFKTATANNGKRRAAQQYYQVHVDLFAELDNGDLVLVANSFSAPLVVRGRSPGHYADNDDAPMEHAHNGDARYHYRNDSISSAGGGPLGSPVSTGEYPYYSGYAYGPSYSYQSLSSASHIAAQSHDSNYYDRKESESYPASPMSPAGPHLGESMSPDMYSSSGFVGPGSPATYNRMPQMASYQGYNGAYGQHSTYGNQQHHHDMYRDQDHETQMAGLRIHSPTSPMPSSTNGSPMITPRRQSFSSSLISKKTERGVGGSTTRKSRSISLSGTMTTTTVSKRSSSKTRSSRTVPATPTKDLSAKANYGYTKDRIPESPMEEQHPL